MKTAKDLRAFTHAPRFRIAIVLKEGKSVVLLKSGVGSRTVPETTVSSKMIIDLRGIITIEL
ncbi:hypothetical protein UP10_34660 [Bradyrhizobium sp. LTSPM299]|nr:hypothetical protein UP10_34660 [Bradyrhizobium sp. LTSPM299]